LIGWYMLLLVMSCYTTGTMHYKKIMGLWWMENKNN
jgi:hypothetical protein